MLSLNRSLALAALTCACAALAAHAQEPAAPSGPYKVDKTVHIGGEGGWDYLTVDPQSHRLYVPRSTHTLVLDEASGKIIADIEGQQRNHGVAIVPDAGRGFITDGKDASVVIFDLKTNKVLGKVKAQDDADGIIYDAASNKVLLVCGDAGVMIPISPDVDPASGKADRAVDLGGKPEFLAADGKGKVFINLEDKDQVAVVDTRQMKVIAHWPVAPGGSPVGMAIDREHHRLFIGCRKPQKMIVMSSDDGKILGEAPIGAGVDATQYDAPYALASCGDGTLTVIQETNPGKFDMVQTVQTRRGARTMGLDPLTHTLLLPTAEMSETAPGQRRPTPKPGSFMIVVVDRPK